MYSKSKSLEAFLTGFLALAPLYIIQVVSPPESLRGDTGDLILVPWVLLILAGVVGLGYKRKIPVVNLLFGSLLGMLIGYVFIAILVGWSYVMFFIAIITATPILVGTGISYWINRR